MIRGALVLALSTLVLSGCTLLPCSTRGEAHVVCAPGHFEKGFCVADEGAEAEWKESLSCRAYAGGDDPVWHYDLEATTECGGECCACHYELDRRCDPCYYTW